QNLEEYHWCGTNPQSRGRAACGWHNRGAVARQKFQLFGRRRAPTHRAVRDVAFLSRIRKLKSPSALVAHCLTIVACVTRSQTLVCSRIYRDALALAPVALLFAFMYTILMLLIGVWGYCGLAKLTHWVVVVD